MREQLIKYVELLFAGTPDSEDMRQEILQNTLDKYDDYISQGKSAEVAYRLAIAGIGDISGILEPPAVQESTQEAAPAEVDYRGRPLPSSQQKTMRAVAIAMYICCVIPVLALGDIGNGALGVCLMFLLIAAATALIILSSNGSKDEEKKAEPELTGTRKTVRDLLNTISLVTFFILSFSTGAWHITWLVFPIMGAVQGLATAIMDLKEASKDET